MNIFKKDENLEKQHKVSSNIANNQLKANKPRLLFFRIVSIIVIPVVFFVIVEFGLRISDYGYPTNIAVVRNIDGQKYYCNNVKFGWRFFPKNIARESDGFVFSKIKPPDTYRIFVLGGSAAQGTPESSYGFGRILGVMLKDRYPGINFEVINVAMPAINSHVVLPIVKDCVNFAPDLFVVYLGNNEVFGPYGARTVFTPVSPSLSAIRASIFVKSTKTGQLLETVLGFLTKSKNVPKSWSGMAAFLEKQIRFDSEELKNVYSHFRENLLDICRIINKSETKVVLCTVGTNLKDCPPFASQHNPDISKEKLANWEKLYQEGIELESNGQHLNALDKYLSADKIDPQFANLQFRTGRMYWSLGKYKDAEERYIKALEMDTLRFRADSEINEIIRYVGEKNSKNGVYLVDTSAAVSSQSPHQVTGKESMYEHAHFNFKGNYILAHTMFAQIEKILPESIKVKKSENNLLSEQQCAEHLAYGEWDIHKTFEKVLWGFIKKPPFTSQLYQDERVKEIEDQIEFFSRSNTSNGSKAAFRVYQKAIKLYPDDWLLHWKYGNFLAAVGSYRVSETELRKALSYLPHCYIFHDLGKVIFYQGRFEEAMKYYHKSLELKPTFASGYYSIASVYHKKKDFGNAIKYYSKALEIDPKLSLAAYSNFAAALNDFGQTERAEFVFRAGIDSFPESASLHYIFSIFLERHGRRTEAIGESLEALRMQPDQKEFKKRIKKLQDKPLH